MYINGYAVKVKAIKILTMFLWESTEIDPLCAICIIEVGTGNCSVKGVYINRSVHQLAVSMADTDCCQ